MYSGSPRLLFTLAIVFLFCMVQTAFAQSQTSPSYQNSHPSIGPAIEDSQSTSYQVSASIGPFIGEMQSGSFVVEAGAPGNPGSEPTTTPPPSGGGGGGGGGGYIPPTVTSTEELLPPPTINGRIWTYLSLTRVFGSRGTDDAEIFVNGSSIDVRYPSVSTWERDLPLGLGNNEVYVQARKDGRVSPFVSLVIRRRLVGDVNDSQLVDDVDLSLFSRHWNVYNEASDFNEDGRIDDVDLSLLASHWGRAF